MNSVEFKMNNIHKSRLCTTDEKAEERMLAIDIHCEQRSRQINAVLGHFNFNVSENPMR